jgi:hypothetical protein
LALLTTDDDSFWEGTTPLQLGGIPELQDPVAVIGYPTGGDNISVSVGVVSRVEPQQYTHGATNLLAIQIDAAINPGNSGGPAVLDHQVCMFPWKAARTIIQNLSPDPSRMASSTSIPIFGSNAGDRLWA